ncbi:hypothetical protein Zmor_007983 [Zophobas morio]|uniref:Uncharacterized protein n=1 Tax=Zophobas morio TaxID=2755281 RepID=A0AA38MPA2_9CUCU|nr:hypothetical protein Zmor_007983 [Zophobas morio]
MSKIVLVLLVALVVETLGQPAFLSDKTVKCYDQECPNTTTACRKTIRTSEDKSTLNTIISCLDAQDMVLKDFRNDEENPFGPGTTFQSTSFSGTYTSHNGGPINVNINNDIDPHSNVEDFS